MPRTLALLGKPVRDEHGPDRTCVGHENPREEGGLCSIGISQVKGKAEKAVAQEDPSQADEDEHLSAAPRGGIDPRPFKGVAQLASSALLGDLNERHSSHNSRLVKRRRGIDGRHVDLRTIVP